MARGRDCAVCGADRCGCGAPGPESGVRLIQASSGPVSVYLVRVGGRQVRMKLNAADAARLRAEPLVPPEPEPVAKKAPMRRTKKATAANKARTSPNKGT